MNIGRNIASERIRAGLLQIDVADHVGVSRCTISNWEKGFTYPNSSQIAKLCELFKCSADDLFKSSEEKQKAAK